MSKVNWNNEIGKKYNRLTVLNYEVIYNSKIKKMWFNCQCDCGNIKMILASSVKDSNSKSCGCKKMESIIITGRNKKIHGMFGTKEYTCWTDIKRRCINKKIKNYHNYGGRGITVCQRWLDSFENFYEDMGQAPSKEHSIDRIDNDGNYEPNNCRWATKIQQANNKSNNIFIDIDGKKLTITQWSLLYGLNPSSMRKRYNLLKNNGFDDNKCKEIFKDKFLKTIYKLGLKD